MPERGIAPFALAITLGFIAGVAAAVLAFDNGTVMVLGVLCGVAIAVTAVMAVVRSDCRPEERSRVAMLRSALGFGLFAFLYVATVVFLRDGQFLLGPLLLAIAGVYAFLLVRVRAPESEQSREGREQAQAGDQADGQPPEDERRPAERRPAQPA